jgi:hypothetical protein
MEMWPTQLLSVHPPHFQRSKDFEDEGGVATHNSTFDQMHADYCQQVMDRAVDNK